MSPVVDILSERKRKEAMKDTWGHLAPKKGQSYKGFMVWAHSAYGDIVLIDANFENLDDSPWLFENMQDFIAENGERGGLYKWEGCYKNSSFEGKIKKLSY